MYLKKILMFIYFWERKRERERATEHEQGGGWGGAERDRYTESELGARLWAVSTEPVMGLELTDYEIMTWAKVWHLTAEPPRHP